MTMPIKLLQFLLLLIALSIPAMCFSAGTDKSGLPPVRKLTPEQTIVAADNYQKYCALCHGAERQGHVNDHAPSLRSKSLFESGIPHAVLRPIQYGRQGTAMGGYLDEIGGPMTLDETWDLTFWLYEQSGVQRVALTTNTVHGNSISGAKIYQSTCATCHGVNGEGVSAPALGNQSALAHNSDEFYRYAIQKGRDGSNMIAFEDKLSATDINDLTAFLRSKAGGWKQPETVLKAMPTPDKFVINPNGDKPNFKLTDGKFVSAKDLFLALTEKRKMVLLDTRVTSVWQTAHIEGSFPLPYYSDFDAVTKHLPKDVMIVAYCSCPRAAAESVVDKLRERGYKNTSVLYEGIFGWMHLGYPVTRSEAPSEALITGEAFYLERIAMPPETTLQVILEDVSLADAPSKKIAEQITNNAGQPPYKFQLSYDPNLIIANHTYVVRVSLRHNGKLLFTTDTHTPVITQKNPIDVHITLKRVTSIEK